MIDEKMNRQIGISALTAKLGMNRQNFYKIRKERHKAEVDADFVEQLVKRRTRSNMNTDCLTCCGMALGMSIGHLRQKRVRLKN